jgi:glutamate-1-semialdehyde 2,1-aminomutase
VDKSQEVVQDILKRFKQKSKRSEFHNFNAIKHFPGGDTRSVAYFRPYPIYMEKGKGCYLYDCDGNEYIDFVNNMASLIHGHAHPLIVEAVCSQLEKGTVFASPVEVQYRHAEHLCSRIPAMDMVRYCNSGTEATLFAMRAARAFTGKDAIIKMDGAYHGTHDFVEVNVSPDSSAKDFPQAHLEGRGIPASVLNDTLIAPFNNIDAVETILKKHKERIAAIIMEPMLGTAGFVLPQDDYLKEIRELANQYDVLLIFDEIMTFRLSLGGMQVTSGVEPDLTTLGKIIGGGFPVGAFGGKKEIMAQFDPTNPEPLYHSGTFSANPVTMVAGLATMELYDQEEIDRINKLGDRLRNGSNNAFKRVGMKGKASGIGSYVVIRWGESEIRNAKDSFIQIKSALELPKLFHLEMINRGIFSVSGRSSFVISTPMTEREIDKTVQAFGEALEFLKPYVAEATPNLLAF